MCMASASLVSPPATADMSSHKTLTQLSLPQQQQHLRHHHPSLLPSPTSSAGNKRNSLAGSLVDHIARSVPTATHPHVQPTAAHPASILKSRSHTSSTAVSHARSQTLACGTAIPHPVSSTHQAASPSSTRFSAPAKRKHLSFRASLLVTRDLLRDPLSGPASDDPHGLADCALDQPSPHSSRGPSLYDQLPSARSFSIDSQSTHFKSDSIGSDIALQPLSHPAAERHERLASRADDLSDALSDYDDSTAQETNSATDIDDSPDNTSDIDGSLADNSFGFPSPMFASKPHPPHLSLEQVSPSIIQQEGPHTHIDDSPQSTTFGAVPELNKPLPRSPGQTSPLGSVFGWGGPTPPATEASSAALTSPRSSAKANLTHDGRRSTKGSFIEDNLNHRNSNKADASSIHHKYADNYLSTPSPSSPSFSIAQTASMVDDMEDELKAISSELAASIRREMDLEDLVDRLQDQINNAPAPNNKRSSDYFSDSGYSSTKLSDVDQGREEIDRIRRRSEQEKASIRLELVNKLQDERSKRKELNRKIKELAEKASHVDIAQINSLDANDRIKSLEETCEDLKRKLSQERESKGGFEDLLTALKGQLRDVSDERDNLRDEVIPELRARIDGLETEAAGYSGLTYESARMQQQLESLRQENSSLRSSIVSGPEEPTRRTSLGLSRSNSLGPSALRGPRKQAPPIALARSDSLKSPASANATDSREELFQRLKDAEAQRDALHSALKSLLERQEHQNREHLKKIRILENERQRLLTSSPRKAGFERDMSKLRVEVNILRRRAEEALEQKWQVEKGLGGLKMDLDRAEEEIESLRNLLKEKDILMAPFHLRNSVYGEGEAVSSESLSRAYQELESAYTESLERPAGEEGGADESARRFEDMASQVQQQLAANSELRERLSAAVDRGETDRQAHSHRISEMQERLRGLEDQVVNAQMASEELATRHEEEMAKMQESQNAHLRRFQADPTGNGSQRAPLGRLGAADLKSSSVGQSLRAVPSKSFEDEAEIRTLRAKVAELEKTLADTEKEMQEVVARMNMAQVEVLNLQEAREAAVRETRRLEQMLKQAQSTGFGALFGRA